jgi:sigma-E factor negative regulatory protein RseB
VVVRRATVTLAVLAAAAAVAVVVGASVAVVGAWGARRSAGDGSGVRLIEAATRAVHDYAFTGVVAVEWYESGRKRVERVPVADQDGMLRFGKTTRVVTDGERTLVREHDGWTVLWGHVAPSVRPSAEAKYDIAVTGDARVAGRDATVVEARDERTGTLRERLYVDEATSLMLRRDQIGAHGRVERSVGFVAITPPATTVGRRFASPHPTHVAQPRAVADVGRSYQAPRSHGNGFRLVDVYEQPGGGVQLYYSDGLFTMSLFEQRGTLDGAALPHGGRDETDGGRRVRVHETPGFETVVWDANDYAFTCVPAAPRADLASMLAALPAARGRGILGSVAHFVLAPFSWD